MSPAEWNARTTPVRAGLQYRVFAGSSPLSFEALFSGLQADGPFSAWYTDLLSACPWEAFFWELPGLRASDLALPAEFVLIDAPALTGVTADPAPFRDYLSDGSTLPVASFASLGGDARLIAPLPLDDACHYAHLAAFVRGAPRDQTRALWRSTGTAMQAMIHNQPLWLSTSGLGVSWLHVRLDSTPKYYQHRPYALAR